MAAAVVVVDSPANIDPHCPIYFLANEDVVTQTPCLDWEPAPADGAGNARVALSTFQAMRYRLVLDRRPRRLPHASSH